MMCGFFESNVQLGGERVLFQNVFLISKIGRLIIRVTYA